MDNEVTIYSNRSIRIMDAILYDTNPAAFGVTVEGEATVIRFVNSDDGLACVYVPVGIPADLYSVVWRTAMKHLHRVTRG